MTYSAPSVTDLGTLSEMTQSLNKVGTRTDIYSPGTPLVGSFVQV